jgi:hypothetical protein
MNVFLPTILFVLARAAGGTAGSSGTTWVCGGRRA